MHLSLIAALPFFAALIQAASASNAAPILEVSSVNATNCPNLQPQIDVVDRRDPGISLIYRGENTITSGMASCYIDVYFSNLDQFPSLTVDDISYVVPVTLGAGSVAVVEAEINPLVTGVQEFLGPEIRRGPTSGREIWQPTLTSTKTEAFKDGVKLFFNYQAGGEDAVVDVGHSQHIVMFKPVA